MLSVILSYRNLMEGRFILVGRIFCVTGNGFMKGKLGI